MILVLALFLLFSVLIAFLPRYSISHSGFNLFRTLIPTWRFFEDYHQVSVLFYRVQAGDGEWSEWKEAISRKPRKISHLFLNPQGTLYFAQQTLLHQFVEDVGRAEDPRLLQNLPSYQLIEKMIRYEMNQETDHTQNLGKIFQFKVAAYDPDHPQVLEDVMFSAESVL